MEKMAELFLTWHKFNSSDTLAEGKKGTTVIKKKTQPPIDSQNIALDE